MADESRCPVCDAPIQDGTSVCDRCGYKLVGQTEAFQSVGIDASEDASGAQIEAASVGVPTLTILKGSMAGQAFHLTKLPLVAGRDPSCDLFLNDMTVTRKHASFDIIDGAVVVTDLGSLNGTWVDGQVCDTAVLKDGSVVQIGTFSMLFNV